MKVVEKISAVYTYECEKCHAIFNHEEDAIKCELSHVDVVDLMDEEFENKSIYPTSINVKMEDESTQTFHLKDNLENMDNVMENVTTKGRAVLATVRKYEVDVWKKTPSDIEGEDLAFPLSDVKVKIENKTLYVDIPDEIEITSDDYISVSVYDNVDKDWITAGDNELFDEIKVVGEVRGEVSICCEVGCNHP